VLLLATPNDLAVVDLCDILKLVTVSYCPGPRFTLADVLPVSAPISAFEVVITHDLVQR